MELVLCVLPTDFGRSYSIQISVAFFEMRVSEENDEPHHLDYAID